MRQCCVTTHAGNALRATAATASAAKAASRALDCALEDCGVARTLACEPVAASAGGARVALVLGAAPTDKELVGVALVVPGSPRASHDTMIDPPPSWTAESQTLVDSNVGVSVVSMQDVLVNRNKRASSPEGLQLTTRPRGAIAPVGNARHC